LREAAPTVGGAAGGIGVAGAVEGTELGARAGLPGAIAGGLAGAFGGGYLVSKGQDWVMDKLGLKGGTNAVTSAFNPTQEQADIAQHPYASTAGALLDTLLSFGTGAGQTLPKTTRLLGAGIMGASEAGQEAYNGEGFDPTKIALSAGTGAIAPVPREWLTGAVGAASGAAARFKGTGTGAIQNPVQTEPGTAGRPDIGGSEATDAGKDDLEVANDLTTTAPGIAAENAPTPQVSGAGNPVGAPMVARTAARPNDPSRNYGKGAPAQAQGVQTQPSQPGFNTSAIDPGVQAALGGEPAAEAGAPQPPIKTGIQPSSPASPSGMYEDEHGQWQPHTDAQNETGSPPAPTARDTRNTAIQAGLQGQPKPAATPALHPAVQEIVDTPFVQQATEMASKRPIVTTQMPSGANSSKDINGPVYVDPRIPEPYRPFLAVHETVEQLLQAQGMKYLDAHRVATAAEHAAVVRAGIPWDAYTHVMDGFLSATEGEKSGQLPPDLHVNPETADETTAAGHHLGKDAVLQHLINPPDTTGVTAPVTPAKPIDPRTQKLLDSAVAFARANAPDTVEHMQNLPIDQQIAIARQIQRKTRGMRGARPTVNGVSAASNVQAEGKQGALDAIKQAVAANPPDKPGVIPVSVPDKQALIARLTKITDAATAANGGADPLQGYKPRVKPPEWQILNAARRAIAKPTPGNIQAYITAEKLLTAGGPGAARDVQDTGRIANDIAAKGIVPEVEGIAEQGRPEFTPFDNADQSESKVYEDQQNGMREWLNGLSASEYARLSTLHPELPTDVEATQDPAVLHRELQEDLAGTPHDLVHPDETPGQPTEVFGGHSREVQEPPIGESEGAASEAITRPPTAEEQARYGGALTPEQLATYKASKANKTSGPAPVPGKAEPVMDAAARFLKDKSGAVTSKLLPYLYPKSRNPIADSAAKDLSHQFDINEGVIRNMDAKLGANFAAGHPQLTSPEWIDAYRKLQDGSAMTPKQQAVLDQYYKPLVGEQDRLYSLAQKAGVPNLPDPTKAWKTPYVPRIELPEAQQPTNDMPWRRGFSDMASALQSRDFFVLDDQAGTRFVFKMNDDGDAVVMRNKKATILKNLPPTFDGELGDTVNLKNAGKNATFKVDHATTPEITAATGIQYAEHPLIARAAAIRGIRAALIRKDMLDRIQSNSTVKAFSTTDKEKADTLGYKPTFLPELSKNGSRTVYYDPRLQQLFDDYNRPGINDDAIEGIRQFAQNMAKPLYLLSPTFHVMNVAANHFVGTAGLMARATSAGKLTELAKSYLPDLYTAYKDVLSQGPIQREMRQAGGRPMYASQVFDHGVIGDMMQSAGMQIAQKPGPWVSFAKATGIPIDQWGHNLMRGSNKIMWAGNDILLTSMYQTAKRLGMSPEEAAEAAHTYIGAYRSDNPKFLGSRALQKIVNEPAFSWFGPYHQDLWNTLGSMYKNVVQPGNPADQREGIAAVAALGLLTYGLYPYLIDPFAKWVTGNKDATFGRRGLSALADIPRGLGAGEPNAYSNLGGNVFTPSIPANVFWEAKSNMDWKGQHILTPGAPAITQAAEGVDYGARSLVPPYSQAAGLARQQGVSVGSVLKKMAESAVGLKEPSIAGAKYQQQQPKHNEAELKLRERHPEGFIEKALNGL
jgi:hypothetical protein